MKVVRGLKSDLQNLRLQCGRDANAVSGIIRRIFEDFGGWVSLASPLAQRDYEDAHTNSANLPKYKNISQQVLQSYISQATVKLLALQKRNAYLHNQVQVKRPLLFFSHSFPRNMRYYSSLLRTFAGVSGCSVASGPSAPASRRRTCACT
jgi:hypothetical protein